VDSEDRDIADIVAEPGRERPEDKPRRWPLVWPWLVVAGLAAIAAGVIGPLIS
jgi:hypothetical protein